MSEKAGQKPLPESYAHQQRVNKFARHTEDLIGGEQSVEEAKEETDVAKLQKLIEDQNKKIESLSQRILEREDPSQLHKVESNVKLEDLDSVYLLSQREIDSLKKQKVQAEQELRGNRELLMSVAGGRHKVFEVRTAGSDRELKDRIRRAMRAEATNMPPKVTEAEKNKLLKEYRDLSEELKKLVAPMKDQWDIKSSHHVDAINKSVALMTTHKKKVTRWQNIAKIISPNEPSTWDTSSLQKK